MTPHTTYEDTIYQSHQPEKKIIFILPLPPTIDFHRKFFVKKFQDDNFSTEYWDVGSILGYDMKFTCEIDGISYNKIASVKELKFRLKCENYSSTVFVLQVTRSLQSLPIYYLLSRLNKKTVIFARGYLPSFGRLEKSSLYYLRMLLDPNNIKHLFFSRAYLFINRVLKIIKKYDVAFVAGNIGEKINYADAIRIARIHHSDIDTAVADDQRSLNLNLPDNYSVFIDEYLPYHPDFTSTGKSTINAAAYYASLNNYFDMIEKKCETTIVIAAHPKAIYETNPFNERAIVFNETNNLVKNARIILTHASTAISFAVIHEKLLCLIYNDEIRKNHPPLYNQMLKTADILGCPIFNFEVDIHSDLANIGVDKIKYKHYYADFLSNADGSRDSFQIVCDEINLLLDRPYSSSVQHGAGFVSLND
jgi:hypothetical protein